MVPPRRGETQQVPVEQHRTVRPHQHVARMDITVTDDDLVEIVPSPMSFDRRLQTGPRTRIEARSGSFEQRVEVPPREGGRRRERDRRRQRSGGGVVHTSDELADAEPVDRCRIVLDALPCRDAQSVDPDDVVTHRTRHRHTTVVPELGEFERHLCRGGRRAHPQDDGTGGEDRVHPGAHQHRGVETPDASCGRRCVRRCRDVADRAVDVRPQRHTHPPSSTSRPGLSRPVGSNSCLIRSCSARTAGSPTPAGAGSV